MAMARFRTGIVTGYTELSRHVHSRSQSRGVLYLAWRLADGELLIFISAYERIN
jgi:hypothetical protein